MSSGIIVAVKTRPYLKDYIIFKYGGKEPIKATASNKLFPMLSGYLTHKPKNWRPPVADSETLLFELPYNEVLDVRDNCFINERHFSEITNFLYGMFYTHFVSFLNKKCLDQKNKWKYKYAIITFMDWYDISIDKINYDSLKRIYQRYRKKFEDYDESEFDSRFKQKNFPKKIPTFQTKNEHNMSLIGP